MLDQATTQDGGVSNMAVGSFTGDGTEAQVTCGFMPRYLKLVNLTDRIVHEVMFDMTAGHAIRTGPAATTPTSSEVTAMTSGGPLLQGADDGLRGFIVPAALNINAKAFHYVAFG